MVNGDKFSKLTLLQITTLTASAGADAQ